VTVRDTNRVDPNKNALQQSQKTNKNNKREGQRRKPKYNIAWLKR